MTHSRLLGPYQSHSPVAWYKGKPMSSGMVLSHVSLIGNQLPQKRYVINMCQDRYAFLIGFSAALCHNQTTLLPPNPSPEVMQQLTREYPDCYFLTDGQEEIAGLEGITLNLDTNPDHTPMENPQFPDSHVAAIAFTSGTTGTPRPNPKTWGSMVKIAQKTGENLPLSQRKPVTVVATVPHQHMYGLETTIMLPLQKGWSIHSGRPFFPEDIASILEEQPSPRILVSTPIHLRACVLAESRFPEVIYTLSATAPLTNQLAEQVEELLHTTMVEIYGFAEAGTIATRQPIRENHWNLLPDLTLESHTDGYAVNAPYFSEPVLIPDTIQPANLYQFTLEGRPSHLINIGGHRASLDALNLSLLSIDGVEDGVFYMPEEKEESITRLVAFVVAPGETVESILSALRTKIASAFLPRPVYLIEALPRNHTGKFLRKDAEALMRSQPNLPRSPNQVIHP